jgi:3-oxoacid CoA-transferase subunit B
MEVMLQSENGLLGIGPFPAGAENILVTMMYASKDGESILLQRCTLPLTGCGCIRRVPTDLAYLEIERGAFVLKERAPNVSVAQIRARTAGRLVIPGDVPQMQL